MRPIYYCAFSKGFSISCVYTVVFTLSKISHCLDTNLDATSSDRQTLSYREFSEIKVDVEPLNEHGKIDLESLICRESRVHWNIEVQYLMIMRQTQRSQVFGPF
jgi:hypothetical protein